jgi:hypothetical protein
MRQRQLLAGQDPEGMIDDVSLEPLAEAPSPAVAFARARALQRRQLEESARARRN